MRIEITPVSPSFGGGALALVGDFLLRGAPQVGTAVEVIAAELLLRSKPSVHISSMSVKLGPGLESVLSEEDREWIVDGLGEGVGPDHPEWSREHEELRSKGAALTFRRVSRRVDVRIVSQLSEYDVFGPSDAMTPETFAQAAREVVSELEVLRRRVKAADDVNVDLLLGHLAARVAKLPETPKELERVLARLEESTPRPATGPWDTSDLDWEMFAPGTKERFDDPFFFDPADDEAPHGNDTGADLLATYVQSRPDDGWAFLDECAREMGFETLEELSSDDIGEHDRLVIAFVFAELMVRGTTSDDFIDAAMRALERRDSVAPSPRLAQLRGALS